MKFLNNKKGNVLLLALLIMTGVVMTGLGLGTLIVNEIRQARNIDNSVIAFYAADLGVEESLYQLRKRKDKVFSDIKVELEVDKTIDSLKIERELKNTEEVIYANLDENESFYIDLYNPDLINEAAGIEAVEFIWEDGDDCGGSSASIDFAYIRWFPASPLDWNNLEYEFVYPNSAVPSVITSFLPSRSYQLRLKALDCGVKNLEIRAYNGDDLASADIVEIPNRVTINSIGTFARTKRAIKVVMPRRSPLSGLYDYIVFSEESLLKEIYE